MALLSRVRRANTVADTSSIYHHVATRGDFLLIPRSITTSTVHKRRSIKDVPESSQVKSSARDLFISDTNTLNLSYVATTEMTALTIVAKVNFQVLSATRYQPSCPTHHLPVLLQSLT